MPPQSKGVGAELPWRRLLALAHKLAPIRWRLLKFREPFNPEVFAPAEVRRKRKQLARRQHSATALGFTRVQAQSLPRVAFSGGLIVILIASSLALFF